MNLAEIRATAEYKGLEQQLLNAQKVFATETAALLNELKTKFQVPGYEWQIACGRFVCLPIVEPEEPNLEHFRY